MATNVILPALGMAQETGKIIRWLKDEGEMVVQGEPLVEIETDKATVELEAPAAGVLANITATPGAEIPPCGPDYRPHCRARKRSSASGERSSSSSYYHEQ